MESRIKEDNKRNLTAEYLVVGAGPAAICAVAKIYGTNNTTGKNILWIDPEFKVGEFGTNLSAGSSVPGNTTVEAYEKVNEGIYAMIPVCRPNEEEKKKFAITHLDAKTTCSLRVASEPLQHITNKLRNLVHSINGRVNAINETREGIEVKIGSGEDAITVLAKRVILAVGAEAKGMELLGDHIIPIHPNTAFIQSELNDYLDENREIKRVCVVGSSHSAALAVMHLLKEGMIVNQLMNKDYRYATPAVTGDGTRYTQYDNTGLKGEVAAFTKKLMADYPLSTGEYHPRFTIYKSNEPQSLLSTALSDCSNIVYGIGYKPKSSLEINGKPLSEFGYDSKSSQMSDACGKPLEGIFGIGVAYPPKVKAISGEEEFAVGVSKFWPNVSPAVLEIWQTNTAKPMPKVATLLVNQHGLFSHRAEKQYIQVMRNSLGLNPTM